MKLDGQEFLVFTKALNPNRFIGKPFLAQVEMYKEEQDCLRVMEEFTNKKTGRVSHQYALCLAASVNDEIGTFELRYLFPSDLRTLRKELGEDTTAWFGKLVTINAVKDGEYARWIIVKGE